MLCPLIRTFSARQFYYRVSTYFVWKNRNCSLNYSYYPFFSGTLRLEEQSESYSGLVSQLELGKTGLLLLQPHMLPYLP